MIDELRKTAIQLMQKNINTEQLKKYKLICEILSHDDCFFKLRIEKAYSILRDLEIPADQIQKTYVDLMTKKD